MKNVRAIALNLSYIIWKWCPIVLKWTAGQCQGNNVFWALITGLVIAYYHGFGEAQVIIGLDAHLF